ncbi:MAG: SRPBCC domain-containing protein [Actinobacteria bacterium]|nr:SRPBCC domain-containing protein [Actinomycetota bacterium]
MPIITTEIAIDAPPERVWDVLMDFAAYPEWNPFITAISGEAALGERLAVTLTLPTGKTMRFSPEVTVCEPQRFFRWHGKVGVRGIFDGHHSFRLDPTQRGTRVEHAERFTGLLGWMMFGKTRRQTEDGFRAMNAALKERAEA